MKKHLLFLLFLPLISSSQIVVVPSMTCCAKSEISNESSTITHIQWNDLLQKHVSNMGRVDYKGFKNDEKVLQSYLDTLAEHLPQKGWSENAVLAYWINAYNAFTVKLILDHYPVKSIKDIKDPWGNAFIKLEGKSYTLEEIEHKILRKMNEPRIHFAINCASYSCPNLLNEAYVADELDIQLETSAKSFINDVTKNTITANKMEISKIFDWFSEDFKTQGTLIDFINRYSSTRIDPNAKISYKSYNWNLNE